MTGPYCECGHIENVHTKNHDGTIFCVGIPASGKTTDECFCPAFVAATPKEVVDGRGKGPKQTVNIWPPVEPGMMQLSARARCRDCEAQTPVAITMSIDKTTTTDVVFEGSLRIPGRSRTFLVAEDISLPEGWGVVEPDRGFDSKIVCPNHNPLRKTDGRKEASDREG